MTSKHVSRTAARGVSAVEVMIILAASALCALGAFTLFGGEIKGLITHEGDCVRDMRGGCIATPGGGDFPIAPVDPIDPRQLAACELKFDKPCLGTADQGGDTIRCQGGALVPRIKDRGADMKCTEAHEQQHVDDWKKRYGDDVCVGVPDGALPMGGEGYYEFIRSSECRAYRVGWACRENLLTPATTEADRLEIEEGIGRDRWMLLENEC